jgi:hypothetical protein
MSIVAKLPEVKQAANDTINNKILLELKSNIKPETYRHSRFTTFGGKPYEIISIIQKLRTIQRHLRSKLKELQN